MRIKPGAPLLVSLSFAPDREIRVGRVALDNGAAVLEYDPEFIASGVSLNPLQASPDKSVVRARRPRIFNGLHGILADSLPDAWGEVLLKRRADRSGVDYAKLTALDKLAIIGKRGMGAFVYEPETPEVDVDSIDLDAIAEGALAVLAGYPSDVLPILERLGGPSGGARPKVLVGIGADGTIVAGDAPLPDGFEAWIVKFRSSRHDFEDFGPLEAAYADMARAAGLDVSPTRLISGKLAAPGYFATKRFDRFPGNARIGVASVAGLLDADWDSAGIDYDMLLRVVRAVTRDQRAVEAAFRRMVFNVVAHNRDDHMKQHSFLMDDRGRWSIAPSYDLVFSSGPNNNHYLAVKGLTDDRITLGAVEDVGSKHGVAKRRIQEIIDQAATAVAEFNRFAGDYDLSASTKNVIGRALAANLTRLTSR